MWVGRTVFGVNSGAGKRFSGASAGSLKAQFWSDRTAVGQEGVYVYYAHKLDGHKLKLAGRRRLHFLVGKIQILTKSCNNLGMSSKNSRNVFKNLY